MKTIKVVADFGIQEVRRKKTFSVLNHNFVIVDFPCKYMNSKEPVYMTKAVEEKTGVIIGYIPFQKTSLKKMVELAIEKITKLVSSVEELENAVKRYEILN